MPQLNLSHRVQQQTMISFNLVRFAFRSIKLLSHLFVAILIALSASTLQAFDQERDAMPGEYVIKLKPMFSTLDFNPQKLNVQLGSVLGAFVKSALPSANLLVVQRAVVETQKSAIQELSNNPLVEYAEPNLIYRSLKLPNDPDFARQWGLKNSIVSQNSVDIDIERAWDITTGSEEMIVAIIDSGIDYNRPDLRANIWTNELELNGKPGVDDDQNGYVDDIYGINPIGDGSINNPHDNSGHGTHCAGTIGGVGDNGHGITGVNWKVKIMGLKFLRSTGEGTLEAAVKAIDYAVSKGAKVLSNSWGSYESSLALEEAIERAHKAGAIFIAAAGNDGTNNDEKPIYPASIDIPNVISVAAINQNGEMSGFSNWGAKTVDIGAPGVSIYGFWKNGETKSVSGTSMAAPFVSGVAALVWSHEPQLTNLELKERLLRTSRPLGSLREKSTSYGMVNAYYALINEQHPPDPNDPANWESIPVSIETDHPYASYTKKTFEVHVPGAKEISLYFEHFDTEKQMDEVKLINKEGRISHNISGPRGRFYSRIIKGDTVKVEFKADASVESYGFKITKAAYR